MILLAICLLAEAIADIHGLKNLLCLIDFLLISDCCQPCFKCYKSSNNNFILLPMNRIFAPIIRIMVNEWCLPNGFFFMVERLINWASYHGAIIQNNGDAT